MALTAGQLEAYNKVIGLFDKGEKRVRLTGSAGTGKTYLAKALVEHFIQHRGHRRHNNAVYVTAPTNKALAVLIDKVGELPVVFKTIHSALRKTLHTDNKTGERKFIRGEHYGEGPNFDDAKFCVIDEGSMIEMEIENDLVDMEFPILYIGDHKQLPPIGEEISPIFAKPYPEVELTEIIRQGLGNPIIDLSQDLDMIYFKRPSIIAGNGYIFNNCDKTLIDMLAEVNGTDELKYLAYTNKVVDFFNTSVRARIYKNPRRLEKEETIIFNTPYDRIRYTNKEEKIIDLEIVTSFIEVPTSKSYITKNGLEGDVDKVRIKYYLANNGFKVIHEDSEQLFAHIASELKKNCRNFAWGWKSYYWFIEQFADIKYNHAITVHKSQGSTYRTAIVNIADIERDRDMTERQKLLYTACTRPSNLLILNNVR